MSKPDFVTKMRPIHRIAGTIIMVFTLFFGVTGLMIQSVDLKAIASHAAATDPEMMAIRESIEGTPNFSVIEPGDYAANALPAGYDLNAAMLVVLKSVRSSMGDGMPLKFFEVRILDNRPAGLVQVGDRVISIDPVTGAMLTSPQEGPHGPPVQSWHSRFKQLHRLQYLGGVAGDLSGIFNALIGIGLFVIIATGMTLYYQLIRARRRAKLTAAFWFSGGWWRSLHRWVSVIASVFLLIVSVSGTLLAIDTVALGIYGATHRKAGTYGRFPAGMIGDLSSPLRDSALPTMLATTLAAYHATEGTAPIKVLRLRYFSGMPQGVIVTGGNETRQFVFNAETGKRVRMTEPSYPYSGFPFGWQEHELMKQIHRGDAFGVPGRLMDIFAGLSLVFLSGSGIYMYLDLLRRRRRGGRTQLFWS